MKTYVIHFSINGTLYVEAENAGEARERFENGEFSEEIGEQLSRNADMAEVDEVCCYDDDDENSEDDDE